jgi:hypothetical protein
MGMQGTLTGVIAFAPEYFSHMDSLSYMGALESAEATNPLTIKTGVTTCTVAVMMEYAYYANFVPSGPPTAGFPASDATKLGAAIESMCTVDLGGAVQAAAVHVADWTNATLRADLLACVAHGGQDGGTIDAGADAAPGVCTGVGQAYYDFLRQNILPPDPSGAPVLIVQGLADIVMPANQEAACDVVQLKAGGLTPQVCTDDPATHTNVAERNIGFAIEWAQAVLAGTSPPSCAESDLPPCTQP